MYNIISGAIDPTGLIKEFEGFRSQAYKCSAGKWTIGYGSTLYEDGTPVKQGDTIDEETAERLLEYHCQHRIKLPEGDFTSNQRAALYSLIYNIGQSAFDRSKLKQAICRGDIAETFRNWDWIKADGKVVKGLVRRRAKELTLFFS